MHIVYAHERRWRMLCACLGTHIYPCTRVGMPTYRSACRCVYKWCVILLARFPVTLWLSFPVTCGYHWHCSWVSALAELKFWDRKQGRRENSWEKVRKKVLQIEIKERGYSGRKSHSLMWNELSCKEESFEFTKSHSTPPAGRGRWRSSMACWLAVTGQAEGTVQEHSAHCMWNHTCRVCNLGGPCE